MFSLCSMIFYFDDEGWNYVNEFTYTSWITHWFSIKDKVVNKLPNTIFSDSS